MRPIVQMRKTKLNSLFETLGQATASSLTAILESGDHVLCAEGIYSGTPQLLGNLKIKGIDFDSADFTDLNNVKQGIKSNTKVP